MSLSIRRCNGDGEGAPPKQLAPVGVTLRAPRATSPFVEAHPLAQEQVTVVGSAFTSPLVEAYPPAQQGDVDVAPTTKKKAGRGLSEPLLTVPAAAIESVHS